MSDPVDALILDLVEWIGPGRPYAQVMEAWRTSCPRLPVWEEANARGYLDQRRSDNGQTIVYVSELGAKILADHRRVVAEIAIERNWQEN